MSDYALNEVFIEGKRVMGMLDPIISFLVFFAAFHNSSYSFIYSPACSFPIFHIFKNKNFIMWSLCTSINHSIAMLYITGNT